jgi:hypothetical protein
MPYSSWEKLKKIIQAYGAVEDEENPTVEAVAGLAGMHRPDVSKNNNFLRESGLLMPDEFKLTPVGQQLSTGIALNNQDLIVEALQRVVFDSPFLSRLVTILKARGKITLEAFRGQIVMEAGLKTDSPAINYIRTVLDLLAESRLFSIGEDAVSLLLENKTEIDKNNGEGNGEPPDEGKDKFQKPPRDKKGYTMPIPLGRDRTAWLELPSDWSSKERTKLIKLLELALADEPDEEQR